MKIVVIGGTGLVFFTTSTRNLLDAEARAGVAHRVAPVLVQPMAADDVAGALADVVVGRAVNGIVEIAGPEQFRFDGPRRSAGLGTGQVAT